MKCEIPLRPWDSHQTLWEGTLLFLECPLIYMYMELTKLFFEDLKSQNYGLCWKGP